MFSWIVLCPLITICDAISIISLFHTLEVILNFGSVNGNLSSWMDKVCGIDVFVYGNFTRISHTFDIINKEYIRGSDRICQTENKKLK